MYTKQISASPVAAQAERLAALRFMVLDTVDYSPYATDDEKARTAASVARCQNADVLVKWYCNLLTVLSEREQAAPTAEVVQAPTPVIYATAEQEEDTIRLCNLPAIPSTDSIAPGLLDSRGRDFSGSLVCPTYSTLSVTDTFRLTLALDLWVKKGRLVECHSYKAELARPCMSSTKVLTVFLN